MTSRDPPPRAPSSAPPSDIGTHCSLSTCNSLDFLPITCPHCSSIFCRHHSRPLSHDCPLDPSSNNLVPSTSSTTPTTRTGPELRELLPDAKRNKLTIGVHAVPDSNGPSKPLTKQQIALAALKNSIDAKKKPASNTGTTPQAKKVNPTIELMRLKQRAKAADPRKKDGDVPMTERWYLTVKLVEGNDEKGTKDVWTQKTVTGGKALDLFADLFQVTNVNHLANIDPSKRLSLALPSAPSSPVDLSSRVDLLTPNGSTILLCRGTSA
ncbi:hypothetical protein JCM16303_001796 [Sporobolomyces ruberrimus]